MPHIESAKKRLRQNIKRRERNRATLSDLRTHIKRVLRACKDGNREQAEADLRLVSKKLDKCGIRGYIHPNKAARTKSRLTKRVHAVGNSAS